MSDLKGTTRAQTLFLRGFRRDPSGPAPRDWPSPVVLRRWLKRPGFCGAMNSILRALRYQADFHLTAAAASGAHLLHEAAHSGEVHDVRRNIESLIQLLRMAHIRNRFAEPLPEPKRTSADLIDILRVAHPSISVRDALRCFDTLNRNPRMRGYGAAALKRVGHPPRTDDRFDRPGDSHDDSDDDL
jgi:hypothetical protein